MEAPLIDNLNAIPANRIEIKRGRFVISKLDRRAANGS